MAPPGSKTRRSRSSFAASSARCSASCIRDSDAAQRREGLVERRVGRATKSDKRPNLPSFGQDPLDPVAYAVPSHLSCVFGFCPLFCVRSFASPDWLPPLPPDSPHARPSVFRFTHAFTHNAVPNQSINQIHSHRQPRRHTDRPHRTARADRGGLGRDDACWRCSSRRPYARRGRCVSRTPRGGRPTSLQTLGRNHPPPGGDGRRGCPSCGLGVACGSRTCAHGSTPHGQRWLFPNHPFAQPPPALACAAVKRPHRVDSLARPT